MRIIRQSSYTAVPWKNGGGITHEAIRVPAEGEGFAWRVSVAQVDASGPFSDFAAYRRYMVLLRGAGVVLRFTSRDGATRVRELNRVGDMEEFDGGLATQCDLVAGACVDLNLMVSKALPEVEARVESFARRWSRNLLETESMLAIPLDSNLEISCGAGTTLLEPWDLALVSGKEERNVALTAQGSGNPEGARQVFVATLPASLMGRQQ